MKRTYRYIKDVTVTYEDVINEFELGSKYDEREPTEEDFELYARYYITEHLLGKDEDDIEITLIESEN